MKRHIPNMLTCANLLCGAMATIYALYFSPTFALLCIVLGAVFDFFDGFAARLLGVQGPMGKELDSLADVVTFGLAPAMMLLMFLGNIGRELPFVYFALSYAALLILPFSALRLAKYNIDTRQSHSFIGLPTPANALFWAALVASLWEMPLRDWPSNELLLLYISLIVIVALSCWILVAEVPMFALKVKDYSWRNNRLRYLFLLAALVLIIGGWLLGFYGLGISASILLYVLLSAATQRKAVTQ